MFLCRCQRTFSRARRRCACAVWVHHALSSLLASAVRFTVAAGVGGESPCADGNPDMFNGSMHEPDHARVLSHGHAWCLATQSSALSGGTREACEYMLGMGVWVYEDDCHRSAWAQTASHAETVCPGIESMVSSLQDLEAQFQRLRDDLHVSFGQSLSGSPAHRRRHCARKQLPLPTNGSPFDQVYPHECPPVPSGKSSYVCADSLRVWLRACHCGSGSAERAYLFSSTKLRAQEG